MQNRATAGFTLIEIMVVLVIIGILMAVVVPNVIGRPDEARMTVARTDLRAIASALDMYKLDNLEYPSTQQGLEALVSKPSGDPLPQHWKEGGYLKKMPVDPWGNPYQYLRPGTHGDYDLYSLGPGGKPEQPDNQKIIGEWQL
jgi:general secretion pathway protein G